MTTELLLYALQLNLYLFVGLASYQFFFRKKDHFPFNRFYLLSLLGFCIFLPLLKFQSVLPAYSSSEIASQLNEAFISDSSTQKSNSISFLKWASIVYMAVSAFLLIRFTHSIAILAILRSRSQKKGKFLLLPDSDQAFSFFNWIFIGDKIPANHRDLILRHEKLHRQKLHSIDIVLCHLFQILFWINPFVFKLKSFFMEVHEYEADEHCSETDNEYVELLLKQTFNQYDLKISHHFNANHLKSRIMKIQNSSNKRINSSSIILTLGLVLATFVFNQSLFAQSEKVYDHTAENKVDKIAEFPGGNQEMFKFIGNNLKYPADAKKEGREGTVYISFVVGKKGELRDYKVLKAVDSELEDAAIKVLQEMPKWTPAEKDGKKVASSMSIPFRFKIKEEENKD